MKKIICIALSALLLTACHAEEKEQQVTGTTPAETTVTTPLTLTEIITEEIPFIPEEEEKQEVIELAVFNPFEGSVKVEESTTAEIEKALMRISEAWSMYTLSANYKLDWNDFISPDDILESNPEEEYSYQKVLFADDEDELFEYFQKAFNENWFPYERFREELLEDTVGIAKVERPSYKTIDGVLCQRHQYLGVSPAIVYDDYVVTYCDENRAEIIAEAQGLADDPEMFFLSLEWSEEYGWRLDNMEYKPCYLKEATLMYNTITLRRDTLNAILGGGTTPDNPRTTVIDGAEYTETEVGISLTEMQEFFEKTFCKNVRKYDERGNGSISDIPLLDEYMRKYINEVYAEIDGILYRRNGAPKWYLPELKIDVMKYYDEQTYIDNSEEIAGEAIISWESQWNYQTNEQEYTELKIASELPIREMAE